MLPVADDQYLLDSDGANRTLRDSRSRSTISIRQCRPLHRNRLGYADGVADARPKIEALEAALCVVPQPRCSHPRTVARRWSPSIKDDCGLCSFLHRVLEEWSWSSIQPYSYRLAVLHQCSMTRVIAGAVRAWDSDVCGWNVQTDVCELGMDCQLPTGWWSSEGQCKATWQGPVREGTPTPTPIIRYVTDHFLIQKSSPSAFAPARA